MDSFTDRPLECAIDEFTDDLLQGGIVLFVNHNPAILPGQATRLFVTYSHEAFCHILVTRHENFWQGFLTPPCHSSLSLTVVVTVINLWQPNLSANEIALNPVSTPGVILRVRANLGLMN